MGCERVDDTTHWTDIFTPLKTEYDDTDTNPSGDEVSIGDDDGLGSTCYSYPSLAINVDNDIASDGSCGDGDSDYRCDDGQCCSDSGFCGPDYDGVGYVNYGVGYFSDAEEAHATYCTDDRLGDWRIDDEECNDQSGANKIALLLGQMSLLALAT